MSTVENILSLNKSEETVEKTALKFSSLTTLALIAYFLIMHAFSLTGVIELRVLNFVILGVGIIFSLRSLNDEKNKKGTVPYFTGIRTGVLTSLFTALMYGVFMIIYLAIDKELMNTINERAPLGLFLNPATAGAAVFFEALSSGVIMSLMAMQYLKLKKHKE